MQNILFVLEIAAIFFLMSKGCISVLLWVMSLILFQMSYEKGNEHIYLEAIEDYPVQDCVKPKKFRFLYKKLNKLSYKGIPKEMYYCETIKVYGFIIYSILAFVMLFIDIQMTYWLGGAYITLYVGLSLLSAGILKRKSFIARYKLLNRYNLKYLLGPEDEPYPKPVGKCRIESVFRRGRKVFAVVRMKDTGEEKNRVLVLGKKEHNRDTFYILYEICNVYYIV